jgi:hypothetical protein
MGAGSLVLILSMRKRDFVGAPVFGGELGGEGKTGVEGASGLRSEEDIEEEKVTQNPHLYGSSGIISILVSTRAATV